MPCRKTNCRSLPGAVLSCSAEESTQRMRLRGERGERCRGQEKRPERVAAVDKIEDKRKPEDFIGHRNGKR